ncbi:YcgN family cysteine cluster protein [Catenovulum adriaticum]|uniref:YcgN family cysteine cluster protein n=1 Tax=Catenovulum adriaticum TaxID=2984846 RepID=A0ABY7ARF5_9ALTE|nr:YcgN family cysteine cluster protein [Catenovulum sp. TS8]WAJ71251.1 YcgN family cysteine cluster protein [Catenovulum sp. TS8]
MTEQSKTQAPFWQTKTLEQMNRQEWEQICDGCGKCCLHKFIADDEVDDIETTHQINEGETLEYTNIVCQYLNDKTCSCTVYDKRRKLVPDCVELTPDNLDDIFYMPTSCSYRRLQEGKGLPSWHPLLNKGKKSKMHQAGMSVRGKVIKDNEVDLEFFEDYIAVWPLNEVE